MIRNDSRMILRAVQGVSVTHPNVMCPDAQMSSTISFNPVGELVSNLQFSRSRWIGSILLLRRLVMISHFSIAMDERHRLVL
jgi:hypothetical protein